MIKTKAGFKRNFYYIIKTDAGVADGKATHSYTIKGLRKNGTEGKIIRSKRFGTLISDSVQAEMFSISQALDIMDDKGFTNIKLQTDCKIIVDAIYNRKIKFTNPTTNRDIQNLRRLVDNTRTYIEYIPRDLNKEDDQQCRWTRKEKKFTIRGKRIKGIKIK